MTETPSHPPARGRSGCQPPQRQRQEWAPPAHNGRIGARPAAFGPLAGAATLVGCAIFGTTNVGVEAGEGNGPVPEGAADVVAFDSVVRPILTETCALCHVGEEAPGGWRVTELASAETLTQRREIWEAILRRVRAGDMPPVGVPKPEPERLDAMTSYIERAFALADASESPDPGRMVAHRLNRVEYMNTVRDLLGVRFRADTDFPADDSGDGFDNMAELLSISPLLMERYMAAAERIAAWAMSTETPADPLEIDYRSRDDRIRRLGPSAIEVDHRIEFGGEYTVRFGLPGERPPVDGQDASPVTLGLWMDDTLLDTMSVETKPSELVYFNPYSEEEMRLYLPPGDHVFRAAFMDDPYVRELSDEDVFDDDMNKYFDAMIFVGPFPSGSEQASREKILACNPESDRDCVERIVTDLARRAYRRPPTSHDVDALLRLVDLAMSNGQSVEDGIQLAIQAILVSPNLLFRIERDPDPGFFTGIVRRLGWGDPAPVHQVSPFELASRLSYFLWSSMPDDELLSLAESGRLRDPGVLEAQVDRMIADPRAAALAENFAGQWLQTRNLNVVTPDPDLFEEWDPELREAMGRETALFFEHVLRENRPISDFLDANYTFLNERLAAHYGIEGVEGQEFRRVELATERRGGVLSQGAVLTVSSYPTRTSPVIRGKYVLDNLLGLPPPPPPPNVPALEASSDGEERSMREQLAMHRTNPVCASCHRNMDPLGYGLENYDAIGRWREVDGEFPIDPSGSLPDGQTFETAAEMRTLLTTQLPQVSRTLTEKMLTYALRRSLESYDRQTMEGILRAVADDDYRFRTMVHEIVTSFPFQARRVEEVEDVVAGSP